MSLEVDDMIDHLGELLDEPDCPLTILEQEFVADMVDNVSEFWFPTEKQEAWIRALYEKHVEG